ncbi:MAG: hypothetical protein JWO74_3464 [Solirubrobacterales bacterium]|nr:hypothetical protein [Solirubrobacterales bacterium]
MLPSGGADDAAMGWQAMDERDSWDGLTNGNVVARAAGVICPMAWMLLADGTDASPNTGEWAAARWPNEAVEAVGGDIRAAISAQAVR